MRHALEEHFQRERQAAIATYHPPKTLNNIEKNIAWTHICGAPCRCS